MAAPSAPVARLALCLALLSGACSSARPQAEDLAPGRDQAGGGPAAIARGSGQPGGGDDGSQKARRTSPTDVVPATAEVHGSLDKELIRRIIRRHLDEVKRCHENQLTRSPGLQGRVSVKFTIAATGAVRRSSVESSTMGNRAVEQCVAAAVRSWEFPKPPRGIVVVTYPFVLKGIE